MYNYGIGELNKKDVDHFTTDIGLKIRRVIDKPFKKACNVFTNANIIYDNNNCNMSDDEYFRQLNDEKIPASHYPLKDGKNNVDMNDLSKFKQYFLKVFDNFKKLGPDTEEEVALWKSSSDYQKLNP